MPRRGTWAAELRTGTPSWLHGPWPDEAHRSRRAVAICRPTPPAALVIGSSQDEPALAPGRASAGIEVVRRSSGGGAVLVAPGSQIWIDVWMPRHDPLWEDDVVRSSWWLGRAWRDSLLAEGFDDLGVHEGRLEATSLSDLVCFAAMGPGEVSWRGRKLVGISQRRSRQGARFHTVCPLHPVGPPLLSTVEMEDASRDRAQAALSEVATCLLEAAAGSAVTTSGLVERVERSVLRCFEDAAQTSHGSKCQAARASSFSGR